ncbi:MAG TPA: hypothetical protein PKG93_04715 [Bacilli bacterium]|nr:hypothetical protein [Bacilli bacterium]
MSILLFWIFSIVVSEGINVYTLLSVIKDLADAGYKIDFDKENSSHSNKNIKYGLFIPIINLYNSMSVYYNYSHDKYNYINNIMFNGSVMEMSKYEKAKYSLKSTGLSALLIQAEYRDKMKKSLRYTYSDEISSSTITYYKNANDDIDILDSTGRFSILSNNELKVKVYDEVYNQEDDTKVYKDVNVNDEVKKLNIDDPNLENRIIEYLESINDDNEISKEDKPKVRRRKKGK